MQRNRLLLIIVLLLAPLGAGLYFYGGTRTPAGQPPLAYLTPQNFAGLKTAFNDAKDDVRLLVLLSPT
ncbi:MAG: hypothetical protein JWO80_1342 [Bryobacterales bacterium]|nr:hypothetical protein [Bryobacterales bacterium]